MRAVLGNTTNDAVNRAGIFAKEEKLQMNSFIKGMSIGIVAGTAMAMMISPPDKKKIMRSGAGRAIKAVGDIVETITDAMG